MAKAVKINITLPDTALREIDDQARADNKTRSGLILEALELFLGKRAETQAEMARRKRVQEACAEIRGLRAKAGDWDGVAEIRRWRDAG